MVEQLKLRRFVTPVISLALMIGCHAESVGPPSQPGETPKGDPTTAPSSQATAQDLSAAITNRGSITFLSWNGKWIGMDGDTDITFLPGGKAHMFEYGIGVSSYAGTYTIDEKGMVTMQFPNFGSAWPKMNLRRDAVSLFLMPVDDRTGFVFGNRGGATIQGGPGSYWPFRPIVATAESGMRERISKERE